MVLNQHFVSLNLLGTELDSNKSFSRCKVLALSQRKSSVSPHPHLWEHSITFYSFTGILWHSLVLPCLLYCINLRVLWAPSVSQPVAINAQNHYEPLISYPQWSYLLMSTHKKGNYLRAQITVCVTGKCSYNGCNICVHLRFNWVLN